MSAPPLPTEKAPSPAFCVGFEGGGFAQGDDAPTATKEHKCFSISRLHWGSEGWSLHIGLYHEYRSTTQCGNNHKMLRIFRNHTTSFTSLRARAIHTSSPALQSQWRQLADDDKKQFIRGFVDMYREKNSHNKNYYKQLAAGMEEHDDIPAVFGLLYNDLVVKKQNKETSAEFDADFFKLVR